MKKKVIIAPLDWGLGHATRCIPIVNYFIKNGWEVIIASDGRALALFEKEYPLLEKIILPSYGVQYTHKSMALNIIKSIFLILYAIIVEKNILKNRMIKNPVDLIISDNRYGFYNPQITSIIITHQTNLIIPFFIKWFVDRILSFGINKFSECWIPDNENEPKFSGVLSQSRLVNNVSYIGVLSRMKQIDIPIKYDVCVIMSGPEPQRTVLEKKLKKQAQLLPKYRFIFVLGKSEHEIVYEQNKHIEFISFLGSSELNSVINSSRLIVSRSGYSTIMDLVSSKSKALLIPTLGQTEQEYLAKNLYQKEIAYISSQKEIELKVMIPKALTYSKPMLIEHDINFFLNKKLAHYFV